ncbi:Hypothetical protein LUCI_3275 [Lucifera butyrica]|uniref:N(6)-L-threonylcarbamoyladenine synthase n=1 Tax=Lucifera butyrica TaxID=1351585 RepID=A0A498RAL6_9FIRM|nr:O-sialoglycoprotein endopeptidase [Lucifera butyrica]VBB08010.1 Hypothetical protein LUCI_3275 [Lucifera butyrica]
MNYRLGIDTSCYTTSVAIMDDSGNLLADVRKVLTVKPGGRGLAQSEMVFQHTRNLPLVFAEAMAQFSGPVRFKSVTVSNRPRPLPGSYMPAFLVGEGYGKVLTVSQQIPLYKISHQENHIWAGRWSADGPKGTDFLAVHISGGTTEIVKVGIGSSQQMSIDLLGGSLDISAGQFVDRIGVALNLPFPAGSHLEKLADCGRSGLCKVPVAVRNLNVSFSGAETYVRRLLAQGEPPAALAAGVQLCVAETLVKLMKQAVAQTGLTEILLVGGVSANQFIRDYLCRHSQGFSLFFPDSRYSSDNAAGCAFC